MLSENEILDAVAGPIDAPALWRLQFWIASAFEPSCVAMIESDGKSVALYLWILSQEQANEIVLRQSWPILGESDFIFQNVCEMPETLVSYWRDWPLADVAEREAEIPSIWVRDGIWMSFRGFYGSVSRRADLSNQHPELQPLRWQASQEVFALLEKLFGWNKLMAASDNVASPKH